MFKGFFTVYRVYNDFSQPDNIKRTTFYMSGPRKNNPKKDKFGKYSMPCMNNL